MDDGPSHAGHNGARQVLKAQFAGRHEVGQHVLNALKRITENALSGGRSVRCLVDVVLQRLIRSVNPIAFQQAKTGIVGLVLSQCGLQPGLDFGHRCVVLIGTQQLGRCGFGQLIAVAFKFLLNLQLRTDFLLGTTATTKAREALFVLGCTTGVGLLDGQAQLARTLNHLVHQLLLTFHFLCCFDLVGQLNFNSNVFVELGTNGLFVGQQRLFVSSANPLFFDVSNLLGKLGQLLLRCGQLVVGFYLRTD